MARQRIIVGIGAALCEESSGSQPAGAPGGLALDVAIQAVRLGQIGIPISRLGQDQFAMELLTQLKAMALDVSHLQSDPDLPTARLVTRRIAGKTSVSLDPVAAFDNLQWDFDLVDVAQSADAIVFGELARRGGQSRTVIGQFLLECRKALRVFDLTDRGGAAIDRSRALGGLKHCDGVVVDSAAMHVLCPAMRQSPPRDAACDLIRQHDLTFLLLSDSQQPPTIHTLEQSAAADRPFAAGAHAAGLLTLVISLLDGRDLKACVDLAAVVSHYAAEHPQQPIPAAMLDDRS